jgi:hypothetical protein
VRRRSASSSRATPYPERSVTESRVQWKRPEARRGDAVPLGGDHQRRLPGARRRPGPLRARVAPDRGSKVATALHVDVNGPHATVYTAGNKNIINTTNGAATNNPPLSIVGLQDGFKVLVEDGRQRRRADRHRDGQLEVPPALEITAENILNAIQMEIVEAGGTANQKLIAVNWMKNKLRLVVNPYIPLVASARTATRAGSCTRRPRATRSAAGRRSASASSGATKSPRCS